MGPSDIEAWLCIRQHDVDLDGLNLPAALKSSMMEILSRTWPAQHVETDLINTSIIWKDTYFRDLADTLLRVGPSREVFSITTLRRLKSARLEGYWDIQLRDFVDWVLGFAGRNSLHVSLKDTERIVACFSNGRGDPRVYQENLHALFWLTQTRDFRAAEVLLGVPDMTTYRTIYERLFSHPPRSHYALKKTMKDIHLRGADCKLIMLHICHWFNPTLKEPAHRQEVKPPIFHHLKPALSIFDVSHPSYDDDESWKPKALSLQQFVIRFVLENWATFKTAEHLLRDPAVELETGFYISRFENIAWRSLAIETRKRAGVPFRLPCLGPLEAEICKTRNTDPASVSISVADQVNSIIKQEFSVTPMSAYEDRDTISANGEEDSETDQSSPQSSTQPREHVGDSLLHHSSTPDKARESTLSSMQTATKRKEKDLTRDIFNASYINDHEISPHPLRTGQQDTQPPRATLVINAGFGVFRNLPPESLQNMTQAKVQSRRTSAQIERVFSSPQIPPTFTLHTPRASQPPSRPSSLVRWDDIPSETAPPHSARAASTTTGSIKKFRILPPPASSPVSEHDGAPVVLASITEAPVSKTERAILLLQDQYSESFEIADLVKAIERFKNDADAGIFLTLRPGSLRDVWLRCLISGG